MRKLSPALILHIDAIIQNEKVDIQNAKVDVKTEKVDFESRLSKKASDFSTKTVIHIYRMFDKFGYGVFGRSAVVELLELQNSSASKLIKKLLDANIIEPVSGYGKGKYKFSEI